MICLLLLLFIYLSFSLFSNYLHIVFSIRKELDEAQERVKHLEEVLDAKEEIEKQQKGEFHYSMVHVTMISYSGIINF